MSKTTKPMLPVQFIVVWDDQSGICFPMGWDDDCEGAICAAGSAVAAFASRKEAMSAIRISSRFAELRKSQGRPANNDFLGDARRNLRVFPLRPKSDTIGGGQ